MSFDSRGKPWPFGVLLFALYFLVIAMIGTFTGKIYGKGGTTDRAKEPSRYWVGLLIHYLCAAFMIWLWLNEKQQ